MEPNYQEIGHRALIYQEISLERQRQDKEFGGAKHNDGHQPHEWVAMIVKQLGKTVDHCGRRQATMVFREKLVCVAALAVAAIESWDRQHPEVEEAALIAPTLPEGR